MSDASQISPKAAQLSIIGVPLQAGTLVTLIVAALLGKNSFDAQDQATRNVSSELADLQKSVTEFQFELRAHKTELDQIPSVVSELATARLQISTLQGEREKLEARISLLEECIRSKARCRL